MDYNVYWSKGRRKRPRGQEAAPSAERPMPEVKELVHGGGGEERDWMDLPKEIVVKVMRMIPPVELLSIRLVCKTWDAEITGGKITGGKTCNKAELFKAAGDQEVPRMLLKHVALPSRPRVAVAVPEDGNLGGFLVLTHGMAEWTPLDMGFLSSPFGADTTVSSVASDGGLLVLNLVQKSTGRQRVLACNPLTRTWKHLRPNHDEARFECSIVNPTKKRQPIPSVECTATTTLTAVVHPPTQALHLHYWVACDYLRDIRFRYPELDDQDEDTSVAELNYTMQVKYSIASDFSSRHYLPEVFPECVYLNLIDTAWNGEYYFSIFLEHCPSGRWCSFRLRWSRDGFMLNVDDEIRTRSGNWRKQALGRTVDRPRRIVLPFGCTRRDNDRDTQGTLVVFNERLFFVVNGCDNGSCVHRPSQCGNQMHVIEVMPDGDLQFVKLGRMPEKFYRRMFTLTGLVDFEEAYVGLKDWPETRRTWGATQHGDCILFYAWGGISAVAFGVPDPVLDDSGIDPVDGEMDESLWAFVPSPRKSLAAECMHVVPVEFKLDATVTVAGMM